MRWIHTHVWRCPSAVGTLGHFPSVASCSGSPAPSCLLSPTSSHVTSSCLSEWAGSVQVNIECTSYGSLFHRLVLVLRWDMKLTRDTRPPMGAESSLSNCSCYTPHLGIQISQWLCTHFYSLFSPRCLDTGFPLRYARLVGRLDIERETAQSLRMSLSYCRKDWLPPWNTSSTDILSWYNQGLRSSKVIPQVFIQNSEGVLRKSLNSSWQKEKKVFTGKWRGSYETVNRFIYELLLRSALARF